MLGRRMLLIVCMAGAACFVVGVGGWTEHNYWLALAALGLALQLFALFEMLRVVFDANTKAVSQLEYLSRELHGETTELRNEVRSQLEHLRRELHAEMTELRHEVGRLRSTG
jgi:hypothetical protein